MDTLIDIGIPVCNSNPEFLKKALDSLLAQTETRWRAFIHDDASTTDIESIIRPYLQDARFTWLPNPRKIGIGGNWNASLRNGSAPYVQLLFQDDWWEPHFLESGLRILEKHDNVGIVSLEHEYVCDEGAESIPDYKALEELRRTHLRAGLHNGREMLRYWLSRELHPNIIGEPDFVMLRRSVYERVGPYLEDMPQNLDMEYWLRCLQVTDWYYLPETYGYFRVHAAATSAKNKREGIGIFDRFRCFEELIANMPRDADRSLAIASRNRALEQMARRYVAHRKGGGAVEGKGKGSGAFKKFAIRHPLVILRSLWRAMRSPAASSHE